MNTLLTAYYSPLAIQWQSDLQIDVVIDCFMITNMCALSLF